MKISLINVNQKNNPYGLFGIYPLGALYLGTVLKTKGYEVRVFDENREPAFNEKTGKFHPYILDSDFVGLTIISLAANRSFKLIQELR